MGKGEYCISGHHSGRKTATPSRDINKCSLNTSVNITERNIGGLTRMKTKIFGELSVDAIINSFPSNLNSSPEIPPEIWKVSHFPLCCWRGLMSSRRQTKLTIARTFFSILLARRELQGRISIYIVGDTVSASSNTHITPWVTHPQRARMISEKATQERKYKKNIRRRKEECSWRLLSRKYRDDCPFFFRVLWNVLDTVQ